MLRSKAVLLLLVLVLRSSDQHQRDKRNAHLPPLVYPFGGTLKLLMGHSIPISMPGRILSFSQNLQFQFPLPPNASFFTDYLRGSRQTETASRRRRRQTSELLQERAIFYELLENEVSRRGGPGKECVKRSICESASDPGLREQGLVGEILHLLLTPEQASTPEEYLAASLAAGRGDDCQRAYDCPVGFGLLDHISQPIDLR